jgi:large subunit ribosomal protein L6
MSRIGKKPILIPSGVDVTVADGQVAAKGPKGALALSLNAVVSVAVEDLDGGKGLVVSVRDPESVYDRAQWGTARANIANLVAGAAGGFSRALEINGVGFRVNVQGQKIVLNLGFSHDVNFLLPEGVTAAAEKNVLTVSGANRELVGQTAARIRHLRLPEPYKGKGIKYVDETIRRKAGKAAKAGE